MVCAILVCNSVAHLSLLGLVYRDPLTMANNVTGMGTYFWVLASDIRSSKRHEPRIDTLTSVS